MELPILCSFMLFFFLCKCHFDVYVAAFKYSYTRLFLRNLTFIVVKGLGRIGSSGAQSDSNLLKSRLASVLSLVSSEVKVNVESVVCFPGVKPVYKVDLGSSETVRALLFSFSRFTRRVDRVPFPSGLENVSIYNCVTPGTRVRISLLRVRFFTLALN